MDRLEDKLNIETLLKELLGAESLYSKIAEIQNHRFPTSDEIKFEHNGQDIVLTLYQAGSQVYDGNISSTAGHGEQKRAIQLESQEYRIVFVEEKEASVKQHINGIGRPFGVDIIEVMNDPDTLMLEECESDLFEYTVTKKINDAPFESYRPATGLAVDEERWRKGEYRTSAVDHFNKIGITDEILENIIINYLTEQTEKLKSDKQVDDWRRI